MDHRIIEACRQYAARLAVPEHHLLAFVEVESNGQAFSNNAGQKQALIRWEGHYFHRRLVNHAEALAEAVDEGLAAPSAGAIPNPRDQGARYAMLTGAMHLCERHGLSSDLACECVSVGLGQVMAAHWKALGYESAHDMIAEAHDEIEGKDIIDQIEMMVRYLTVNDLLDDLVAGRWEVLARGYNGPAYAKHGYHTKLAAAAARWAGGGGVTVSEYPTLKFGDSGPLVSALQEKLGALGYARGAQDGHFGSILRATVLAFQADHSLVTDGIAGPKTWRALEKSAGRPIGAGRAMATANDLRKAGSSTIRGADLGQAGGIVLGGLGGAGTLSEVKTGLDTLNGIKGALSALWGTGQELLPVILILVGGGVFLAMHLIKKNRVKDHRSGANLGR